MQPNETLSVQSAPASTLASASAPSAASPSHSRLERFSRCSFLIGIVLALLAVVPTSWMPSTLLKVSLFSTLLSVSVIALFFMRYRARRDVQAFARVPGRFAVLATFLLPVAYLVSWGFSTDKPIALMGFGGEVDTVAFTILGFIALMLASTLFRSVRASKMLLRTVTVSIVAALIVQCAVILLPAVSSMTLFGDRSANLIGKWNDFAIVIGLLASLALVRIEFGAMRPRTKIAYIIGGVVLLGFLTITNFITVWILFALVSAAIVLMKYMSRRASSQTEGAAQRKSKYAWFAIIALVISIAGAVWGNALNSHLPNTLAVASLEVRPGLVSTYQVAANSFGTIPRTLVGTGPGTFNVDWNGHKPVGVNLTQFWSINFGTGYSVPTTAFATAGVLGAVAWLLPFMLVLWGMWNVRRAMHNLSSSDLSVFLSLGISSLFLWLSVYLYAPSQVVVLLAFVMTGAFFSAASALRFAGQPQPTFSSIARSIALLFTFVIVLAVIAGAALFTRRLVSLAYEQQAVLALSNGDLVTAFTYDAKSQSIERTTENARLGTEILLARIQQIVSAVDPKAGLDEQTRTQIQTLITNAATQGMTAAQLSPLDYRSFVDLGNLYGYLATMKVQGAYDSARAVLGEAIVLNPTDPSLPLMLARVEATEDLKTNMNDVQGLIMQSLQLKNNYTDALLAAEQLAVAQNDLQTATAAAQAAVHSAPDQASLWFELGLLYYAGNNMQDASIALEQAVALIPNYANAKYFLGLSYAKEGKTADAIKQFQDLQQTNPDNAEVKLILANLQADKDPFAGAKPPVTPNPAARTNAPIKE